MTFTSTGAEQCYTVPATVTSLSVTAVGAPGVTPSSGGAGGNGATVTGTLSVSPGQTLYVEVGGLGSTNSGGFNGGGSAVGSTAGGGGGASDVRTCSSTAASCPGAISSLQSRLLVAGGGGG
ncbi:MAG: glycine-rich protein, partial [Solirubrobacteraceae bacterium]